jgi:hypothetical protein
LTAGCPDLSIRISLNVPSNATGTYLLDNLRFGGSGNQVLPTVNCVARRTSTLFTAYFGYINLENQVATIPIGPDNTISPGAADQKQPTVFEAGSYRTAVAVDFAPGGTVSWRLTAGSASANANSTVCPGSVATAVRCPGVPASAADGCVNVIELPNPHSPDRDPAVIGRPFDPSTLPPAGPTDPDEDDEAAVKDFRWSPITTVTVAPGVTQTFSLPVSESSVAAASALWSSAGQMVLSLQMGLAVKAGSAVDLGSRGGLANVRGSFTGAGTIQVVLKNTGTTSVSARVVTGVVASSKAK